MSKPSKMVTGRKLTFAYVAALAGVGILVTGEFLIQKLLLDENKLVQSVKDSTGAQRAAIQSISIELRSLALADSPDLREEYRERVRNHVTKLNQALQTMDRDFEVFGRSKWVSAENLIPLYYTEALGIRKRVEDYRNTALALLELPNELLVLENPRVRELVNVHRSELISVLNTFVSLATLDAESRLNRVDKVYMIAYSAVILLLFATGIFIFRPVVSSVVRQQFSQAVANRRLEERADDLARSRGKLRRQTRILQSVLDTMGDAVIVVDEAGDLILQNPAAERLFGVIEEGCPATKWHESAGLMNPDTDELLPFDEGPVQRALHGKRFNELVIKLKNKNLSRDATLSTTGRKMLDEEGSVRGAVISFHDISDRIQKEKELTVSKVKAESANIAKTQFLANISHEIRTPMGAILGFADRLTDNRITDDERGRHIGVIRRNARALMQLIDDLLDISRVEAGKLSIDKEWVELSELMSEVYGLFAGRAEEKKLNLSITVVGEIPEKIFTDIMRLRQILVNLIGNAVKFTAEGSVTVSLGLVEATAEHDSQMTFTIEDTGCGMRKDHLPKLFRPFGQMDSSTTRKYGGTGLGLNLSKRLAEALGGDLELIRTEVNVGTTIQLAIPTGPIADVALVSNLTLSEKDVNSCDLAHFPEHGLEGWHILVVEDGEENRELLSYYLEHAGAKVSTAEDGLIGVDMALSEAFDLVLMDIQMPRLDGFQALEILLDKGFQVPVVALTAHAMKEERDRCRDAGFAMHIAKPVDSGVLVQTVRQLILESGGRPIQRNYIAAQAQDESGFGGSLPPRVREIIKKFISNLPQERDRMREAYEQHDFSYIQRSAHKLKGTAGACGLSDLMSLMMEIESLLESGDSGEQLLGKIDNIAEMSLSSSTVSLEGGGSQQDQSTGV